MPVIVLVADGARVDAFAGAMDGLPALRRLRDEGGLHVVTSVFPSVTGPAYTPFLVGRFPGGVGIPGIRWFDRARTTCRWPSWSRSYVGIDISKVDTDLAADVPTIFDLVPNSLGAMSVITRGLARHRQHGTLTIRSALRVATTHFRGPVDRWLEMDREVLDTIPRIIREERPDFVFAAMVGVDKGSHSAGADSAMVRDALALVDATAARIRDDAERGGYWDSTHLWIVSDHGHSAVHTHDDLADVLRRQGFRTVSHPVPVGLRSEVAVMVSGNAMAHVYVDLARRTRPWWPALAARWNPVVEMLSNRSAVDLVLLPVSPSECVIRSGRRGDAVLTLSDGIYRYRCASGDPLGAGCDIDGDAETTYDAMRESDYPDALVQIMALAGAARSGDIILSASPGFDFRARFEPVPHVSAHGALHRDHMLVPLLTNRRPARIPRRTADVFASAIDALGVREPGVMDGVSFIRRA